MATKTYNPSDFGKKEIELKRVFDHQVEDARKYFLQCIKPRLDRSYKLYIAYNGDRSKEIKKWQANVFVPYIHAVVETLMPRILDARPEFGVQGRTEEDHEKALKLMDLCDYTWEVSGMDSTNENIVRSALIYGTGFLQVYWKKDVREHSFLSSKDLLHKKLKWNKKKQTFYDAPYAEWVDNYGLWYDWHNVPRESKQYWFKRLVLSWPEIERRYPGADKKRLEMAKESSSGDITDYANIRNEVKLTQDSINKGSDYGQIGVVTDRHESSEDADFKMHEVFEWTRPFEDKYAVMVNDVPILRGGFMPIAYDFKEAAFVDFPYLKLPGEFEGYGIPMILENPQIMMNMIKNQRLDAMTLNIHKMWIVNPLANIDKSELVVRPFGIIYSTDPAGVKEVQFSDIKASAYKEEELLKSDMRYSSGVDDFSMGSGAGSAGSATEVRHMRESTLERVRMFVNHLGDGYGVLLRYWIDMYRQFFTKSMTIRVIGEDGLEHYPLIEKDDLMGRFDYKAAVLPSIAGKQDVDKKQGMDLFQLLINLPFVDPMKLTGKVLQSWNWSFDSIAKQEEQGPPGMPGAEGMPPGAPGTEGMPPELAAMMEQQGSGTNPLLTPGGAAGSPAPPGAGAIPSSVMKAALGPPGGGGKQGFGEAGAPINLLKKGGMPPTAPSVGKTTNPRGLNRGGKVNTNIATNKTYSEGSKLAGQAQNIQR